MSVCRATRYVQLNTGPFSAAAEASRERKKNALARVVPLGRPRYVYAYMRVFMKIQSRIVFPVSPSLFHSLLSIQQCKKGKGHR